MVKKGSLKEDRDQGKEKSQGRPSGEEGVIPRRTEWGLREDRWNYSARRQLSADLIFLKLFGMETDDGLLLFLP